MTRASAPYRLLQSFPIGMAIVVCALGCASLQEGWRPPQAPSVASRDDPLERLYADAQALDTAGDPRRLDAYAALASSAWAPHRADPAGGERHNELYGVALQRLLLIAAEQGRYDPLHGILLTDGSKIPVVHHGFVWSPQQFGGFLPVGDYDSSRVRRRYVAAGVGVPMVVFSKRREPFVPASTPFAATAVLRLVATPGGPRPQLEWYDPLRCGQLAGQPSAAIAGDPTAPIGYSAIKRGRSYITNFIGSGATTERRGLYLIEPFQRGKIPVVFVHGLLSDPVTWADLANELRQTPDIASRYQLWAFQYPTGEPFLRSAAELRRRLAEVRAVYDPSRNDPALSRMVLIGHSMGGLIAKLQVTNSGTALWDAVATRPFSTLRSDPRTRGELAGTFFFAPSPDVARVVFSGTPHRGASSASRWIGRLGSALVEESDADAERVAMLRRDNPGLFRTELGDRIPTSVDLLRADNRLLLAMNRLPYRPGVRLHSIIGDARWGPLSGPSDGLVSVDSARLEQPGTELVINAKHSEVHRERESIAEVVRILREHACGDRLAAAGR